MSYVFQQAVIEEALARRRGCILHMEQGLGKTHCASKILSKKFFAPGNAARRALIVVTAPKVLDFFNEIQQWNPELAPHLSILSKDNTLHDNRVMVGSYQMVVKADPGKIKWDIVILDESQNIKSYDSKRTKTLLPVLHAASYVLLLTGTLMSNAPYELYTQIDAVSPKRVGTWFQYIVKYCEGYYDEHLRCWQFKGHATERHAELNAILDEVRIRRRKVDCLKLPRRRRVMVRVQPSDTGELVAEWDKFRALCRIPDNQISRKEHMVRQQCVQKLAHMSAECKMHAAFQWLDARLSVDAEQLIVFCAHVEIAKRVTAWLQEREYSHMVINSQKNNTKEKRLECVRQFQANEVRVAVLGLKACCEGINLTPCFRTLYLEFNFVPGDLSQAECRTDRIGATHQTEHVYMVCNETYEDKIVEKLGRKDEVISDIGDQMAGQFLFDSNQEFNPEYQWRHLDPVLTPYQKRLSLSYTYPRGFENMAQFVTRAGHPLRELLPNVPTVYSAELTECRVITSTPEYINASDALCVFAPLQ